MAQYSPPSMHLLPGHIPPPKASTHAPTTILAPCSSFLAVSKARCARSNAASRARTCRPMQRFQHPCDRPAVKLSMPMRPKPTLDSPRIQAEEYNKITYASSTSTSEFDIVEPLLPHMCCTLCTCTLCHGAYSKICTDHALQCKQHCDILCHNRSPLPPTAHISLV